MTSIRNLKSIFNLLNFLWYEIGSKRQRQLTWLLVFMILASVAEMISIGLVVPFIAVLTTPANLLDHPLMLWLMPYFHISSYAQAASLITCLFIVVVFISAVIRVILLWLVARLSFAIGADFSFSIYQKTLYQPYKIHSSRNSSAVVNAILVKVTSTINGTVIPAMNVISILITLIMILALLFMLNPMVTTAIFVFFSFVYCSIIWTTKKQLLENGSRISSESNRVTQCLQEGLGGIRDILINGIQEYYCRLYKTANDPLCRAQANNIFLSGYPRFLVEFLAILIIAIFTYSYSLSNRDFSEILPTLGAITFSAQRLLPMLQQLYGAWSSILGNQPSALEIKKLLSQATSIKQNDVDKNLLEFQREISLNNIDFHYESEGNKILEKINIRIKKGERVGIIGKTGCGKSTLMDIIMGLLEPTFGEIKVDGVKLSAQNLRSWQDKIAHVPQSIYLSDATIAENIAFGVSKEKIDFEKIKSVAKHAKISMEIEMWPNKYQTIVGERGVRLSGGQRQRIGIARALYKDAEIITLDEATSALDEGTESEVMLAINKLSKNITIIIIAHRLSTIKDCTQIVDLGTVKCGIPPI